MAAAKVEQTPTPAQLRSELQAEREQLVEAVESLRGAADYQTMLRARVVMVAAIAFAGAFVLSGGVGATVRLVLRRGREGHRKGRPRQVCASRARLDRGTSR